MDWSGLSLRFKALLPVILLPLILGVALGLRLYGLDWDQGYGFHPDERSIYMRADCMFRVLAEVPGYEGYGCFRDNPEMDPGVPGIGTFLDAEKSPLNPHWFPLGSIIIYLLVGLRSVLEPFTSLDSLMDMAYMGRTIAALADVGSVFMVYLLGKRAYDRRVGLLAAALVALAVIHVQISHFYRPEPLLVFFLLAAFWSMLRVIERRRLRDSAMLGLFVGLAFATKVSILPLFLPLVLAYGFRLFTTSEGRLQMPTYEESGRAAAHALLGGGIAAAVFLVLNPYSILDFGNFIGWLTAEANIARNAGSVPYTVQYIDSTPFLYELRQSSLWGMGLPLGIAAWGGLLFTILINILGVVKKRPARRAELLILAWVVPNLILVSAFEVKFLRYIFPVTPFLILMGSAMLFWALDRARIFSGPGSGSHLTDNDETPSPMAGEGRDGEIPRLSPAQRSKSFLNPMGIARYAPQVAIGIIAFVVASTAFYAIAFERVYAQTHPGIQVSRWINDNVPQGSTIITDNHWDEGIPDIYDYKVAQIPIYEGDTNEKMDSMAKLLSKGDYLVFYSNRTYGSVGRVPERYPLSARYYRLLFSGKLGYRLERSFTAYPKFLGVAFVDDTFTRAGVPEPDALPDTPMDAKPAALSLDLGYADNDVITYDHPKTLLFKNVEGMSSLRLYHILTAPLTAQPMQEESSDRGLMLSAEDKAIQREGGTWSRIIKVDSWTNRVPVLAWLLLVEVIYLAALPLATFLFRPLPDRGIVLARILGVLGVGYVAWMLASLGWMDFSRTSVLVGILTMALLSTLVLAFRWREFKESIKENWRLLAIGEALFLVAFLAFVAIRAANPDLWHPFRGGEKPMDFAYLNAVLRSTTMPPYDPWFSGGYLNYYYWGQFVVAMLIKATGIVPSVAYNLAVPLLFALTLTGAYSIVYNVTSGLSRAGQGPSDNPSLLKGQASPAPSSTSEEGQSGGHHPHPNLPPSRGKGLGILPWSSVVSLHYPSGGLWRWGRWALFKIFGGIAWGPVVAGLLAGLFVAVMGNLGALAQLARGAWNSTVGDDTFPRFDFWASSRMIPPLEEVAPSALRFWLPDRTPSTPDISHHITEFPFFTFLFADLHAHMIAIPFTLLAIGLAFSLLVGLRTYCTPKDAADASPLFPTPCTLKGTVDASPFRMRYLERFNLIPPILINAVRRLGWPVLTTIALSVAVGALWAINSWDYPAYLVLAIMIIGAGVYLMRRNPLARIGIFSFWAAWIVLLSILAFLPFRLDYHPFPTGLDVSKWQTPIQSYLGVHSLFIFLLLTFLMYMIYLKFLSGGRMGRLKNLPGFLVRRPSAFRGAPTASRRGIRVIRWSKLGTGLLWVIGAAIVIYMGVAGYWTAAMLALALALTLRVAKGVIIRGWAGRSEGAAYALLPIGMVIMALLIGIGVEFVRSESDIGRMNTQFKYYLAAWVLLGMASACILWYLGSRGAFSLKFRPNLRRIPRFNLISLVRGWWLLALALLLAAGFIYPILGTRARLADRFNTQDTPLTLDGAEFMLRAVHSEEDRPIELRWDYDAIRWLQDNVEGSPVVLEAHRDQYHWSARIANYTGLPTVLGWHWHQRQQRAKYDYVIWERGADVNEMYSTPSINQALELLRRYEVEYVVVGQLERAYYPEDGLRKFDTMTRQGLAKVVYQNDGVRIYQGLWYN